MRRFTKIMGVLLLGLGLGACMQSRPKAVAGCDYRAIQLSVDSGHPQIALAQTQLTASDGFAAELRSAVARTDRSGGTPGPQFLVLSGGSQHGAFGAGFFHGMPSIPTYDVVTGVSTGSLQSTMLFLANSPPPKDRTYAWVDGPLAASIAKGQSSAGDLALAFSIAKEGDIATPASGGILGGLSKGGLASFGPLEKRLAALLSPDTFRQIAAEGAKGRKLFVGVVNLDDGNGYAVDLTDLAARIDTPAWSGKFDNLQQCYIAALVASSSVPPSAYPVSLTIAAPSGPRTNMYMDGGARFGVFLEQILRAIGQGAPKDSRVTVIVNGNLYGGAWTEAGKPVDKWSSLTVASRAVALLENQVYRFSVASAEDFGTQRGGLDMAFISNEGIAGGEVPSNHRFAGKTCTEWTAIDNQAKPLEFHPNYMACLSDYGVRGAAGQWNRQIGAPAPATAAAP